MLGTSEQAQQGGGDGCEARTDAALLWLGHCGQRTTDGEARCSAYEGSSEHLAVDYGCYREGYREALIDREVQGLGGAGGDDIGKEQGPREVACGEGNHQRLRLCPDGSRTVSAWVLAVCRQLFLY